MNILFLSLTFPDQISPERGAYNLGLCSALARGNRVRVVAPRSWHEWAKVSRAGRSYAPSAETRANGLTVDFPIYWYLPRILPGARGAALWHSIRNTVAHLPADFRPDVVLSYWAYPDADAGLRAAQRYSVPSVVIVGGSDVLMIAKESGQSAAVRRVLAQSHAVTTVSDGLRRATIALGIAPERVQTIRQGIDPAAFHTGDRAAARQALGIDADEEMLLWVGRMVPVKNLDMLVTAVAQAAVGRPRLRLHLIGDGESQSAIEARVRRDGLAKIVRFEGPVAHDQLPQWYRAADATVLSSHSEGLPNVLRESLACGTPFVATDVGNISEIARPEFSRLSPAGDPGALAGNIAEVLVGGFREAAGLYRPRTWSDCAEDYNRLFREIVHRGPTVSGRTESGGVS